MYLRRTKYIQFSSHVFECIWSVFWRICQIRSNTYENTNQIHLNTRIWCVHSEYAPNTVQYSPNTRNIRLEHASCSQAIKYASNTLQIHFKYSSNISNTLRILKQLNANPIHIQYTWNTQEYASNILQILIKYIRYTIYNIQYVCMVYNGRRQPGYLI